MSDVNVDTLAETENYVAWLSKEPDGENVVHLELGPMTLHFFQEEWKELLELIDEARQANNPGKKKK
jgi:hypothetical protein